MAENNAKTSEPYSIERRATQSKILSPPNFRRRSSGLANAPATYRVFGRRADTALTITSAITCGEDKEPSAAYLFLKLIATAFPILA